jgi:GMP synthase-like glutamine amidotransferase
MIASAFGCRVFRAQENERGWYRITAENGGLPRHPASFMAFKWPNETFDLLAGAALLSTGAQIRNQVFRFGSCIGVQYHMEATPHIITEGVQDLSADDQKQILSDTAHHIEGNVARCAALLDHFIHMGGEAWRQKPS